MAVLPNHSHCRYCGNPVEFGEEFCDEDCKELDKAERAVERKKDIMFYGMIVVSLVAILIVGAVVRLLL